jgi:hypothetical protein
MWVAKAEGGAYKDRVSEFVSTLRRRARVAPRAGEGGGDPLETSALGRALLSLFLIFTLVAIGATNLPDSALKGKLLARAGPYLTVTGLDQNWGVFAPDTRRSVISLVATVQYADGSTDAWRLPEGEPVLGGYWDYRWRKWAEQLMTLSGDAGGLQRPAAIWIAGAMERPGKRPALVTLATRSRDLPPPGTSAMRPRSREEVFYRLSFR